MISTTLIALAFLVTFGVAYSSERIRPWVAGMLFCILIPLGGATLYEYSLGRPIDLERSILRELTLDDPMNVIAYKIDKEGGAIYLWVDGEPPLGLEVPFHKETEATLRNSEGVPLELQRGTGDSAWALVPSGNIGEGPERKP